MAIAFKIWLAIIELLIFTSSGVFIVVYGTAALCMPDTKTAGVLKLIVDISPLFYSTVLIYVDKSQFNSPLTLSPPALGASRGNVQSLQSEAPITTTIASNVIGEADEVELNAPENCTIGTKYFCLWYANNVTCSRLPLNVSDLLSRALPFSSNYQLSSLNPFDQKLKYVSFGTIEGPLVLGITSTVILITVLQYTFWKGESVSAHLFWGVPQEIVLLYMGNSVCIVSFLFPTIILWSLYSKTGYLPSNITTETGRLLRNCIPIFCFAVAMALCVISMFLRKYIFYRDR